MLELKHDESQPDMVANTNRPSADVIQLLDGSKRHATESLPESANSKVCLGSDNKCAQAFTDDKIYRAIDFDSNAFEIEAEGRRSLFVGQDYGNSLRLIERFTREILDGTELGFVKTKKSPGTQFFTPLKLAYYFNMLDGFFAEFTPDKKFSPSVELFFNVCIKLQLCCGYLLKNPNYYYPELKKTGAELFNEIIASFRSIANSKVFKNQIRSRINRISKNAKAAEEYVDFLLQRHGSLNVFRFDLTFNASLDYPHTISVKTAHDHLKKFLNSWRSNKKFKSVVGYLWKRERGRERGIYFHLILFVTTKNAIGFEDFKAAFASHWRQNIGELGVCVDCSNSLNPVRRYGIGTFDRSDITKREELFLGIRQLFEKEYFLSDNAGGKHRTWRCGEWPHNKRRVTPGRAQANVLKSHDQADITGCQSVVPQIDGTQGTISVYESNAPLVADLLIGHIAGSGEPVYLRIDTKGNPHLIVVGQPGMGKTHALINICRQLFDQGIVPIVFSYHQDIDAKLDETVPGGIQVVSYNGLGFNPMEVLAEHHHAYLESVDRLRDIFAAIFPDLGEVQLGSLRGSIKKSYENLGWSSTGRRGRTPGFGDFMDILKSQDKVDLRMLNRLDELSDYGFFDVQVGSPSLLDARRPTIVQIHSRQSDTLQRAFATFVLYNVYQNMFRRGPQLRLTHAIVFDEAHRASKLKLIPTMAKECRKFGLSLVLASQEIKDFDPSLFSAVSNSLTLRLLETDAARMASNYGVPSEQAKHFRDTIKQLPKYNALFNREGLSEPVIVQLQA